MSNATNDPALKITSLELAQHVVNQMDHSELHESAIAGLVTFYDADPDKFKDDLETNGFNDETTLKEGEFSIQIGRDATVYYSATVKSDSLEDMQSRLSRHGFTCPDDTVWKEDGNDTFDNIEVAYITSPDGTITEYTEQSGWTAHDKEKEEE